MVEFKVNEVKVNEVKVNEVEVNKAKDVTCAALDIESFRRSSANEITIASNQIDHSDALKYIKDSTGIVDWVLTEDKLSLALPPKSVLFSEVRSLARIVDFQFACLTDAKVISAGFEFNPSASKENVLAEVEKIRNHNLDQGRTSASIFLDRNFSHSGVITVPGEKFGGPDHYAVCLIISPKLLSNPKFLQVLESSSAFHEALAPIKALLIHYKQTTGYIDVDWASSY
jgi:hypothetical protein